MTDLDDRIASLHDRLMQLERQEARLLARVERWESALEVEKTARIGLKNRMVILEAKFNTDHKVIDDMAVKIEDLCDVFLYDRPGK